MTSTGDRLASVAGVDAQLPGPALCLNKNQVLRNLISLIVLAMAAGCSDWPPAQMFPPDGTRTDSRQIDPWIARILGNDVATAQLIVNERLATDLKELQPMVRQFGEFTPCQVHFRRDVGYLRCVRRYRDVKTGEIAYQSLFISEPMAADELDARLAYFDESIRPLMRAFLERFAGSGEEMEGDAGQFTRSHWPTVSDFTSQINDSHRGWIDARLLYSARNGDAVFVQSDGSTAWHVLETNEIIPIAESFSGFIDAYTDFRRGHEAFDSWSFQDRSRDRAKR